MTKPRFKPTEATNAGRLLRKAADVLEDRVWVQGLLGTGATMCVRGAINFTKLGKVSNDAQPEERQFSHWLYASGLLNEDVTKFIEGHTQFKSFHHTFVPSWNDAIGRTKEEVIQYMRKFADEVDPQRP